ncbi:MAG: hypothetical protein AMK72_13795 [Planctomycetes bacterium SM23_25]|nr:MAG: hypothetical protein AMK72_13795 [Planctomycetes bacterium SM23_25]
MSVRIYELSREFDMPSKEVLEICREVGLEVKSHSSTIDEDEADPSRPSLNSRPKSNSNRHASGSSRCPAAGSRNPRPKG